MESETTALESATPIQASVGVADNALEQMKSLVPDGQQAGGMTVLLALVGVAGGGAAFKLYRDFAKNKHEQAMKMLEIEQQRADKSDEQHKSCAVERASIEARVTALQSRLEEIAAKAEKAISSSSSLPLADFEEIEQRVANLEGSMSKTKRSRK